MRTVIATSFTPTLDSGRARRTYGVVAALARHGEIDLVYGRFGADAPDRRFEELPNVTFHPVDRPSSRPACPPTCGPASRGIPDDFARGIWPRDPGRGHEAGRRARRRAAADRRRGPGGRRRAAAAGDAAARLLLRPQPRVLFPPPARRKRHVAAALERFERLLLERYAESWMVSEADMKGPRRSPPGPGCGSSPTSSTSRATEPVGPRSGQRAVAFVADFGYEPNRDGARLPARGGDAGGLAAGRRRRAGDRRQGQRRDRRRPTRGSSRRASSPTCATSTRPPAR